MAGVSVSARRKVALVTGSARGIGFAIARQLVQDGLFVVVNGVSKPELPGDAVAVLQAAGKESGGGFHYIQADVTSAEGRHSLVEYLRNETRRIDVLVNNSGVAPKVRADLLDMPVESFRRVLAVNLEAPFFLTQEIARFMLELHGTIENYDPCIINISSISAYTASVNRGQYCISKAGLSMMTALFAARLGDKVHVHEIRPGIIATDMTSGVLEKYRGLVDDGLLPVPRIGKPDDIAKAVSAIVAGYFPYSTGNVFDVDGGFHLRRL